MIPIITIIIIVIVVIALILAIPSIINAFITAGTQLHELNERNNLKQTVENTIESTLDATETWCSLLYDDLFELLQDQINNPRIQTAKVIYDKVGYLDDCRVDELISYLDKEQRKKFDRMEIVCNLNSCTKAVYDQFKQN